MAFRRSASSSPAVVAGGIAAVFMPAGRGATVEQEFPSGPGFGVGQGALGLLFAEPELDESRSFLRPLQALDSDAARAVYAELRDRILTNPNKFNAREHCFSLELTWHAIMGEPAIMPFSSSVNDLWRAVDQRERQEQQQLQPTQPLV